VSDLQGEGNVTLYINVCLIYRLREGYCVHSCVSDVQGEEILPEYIDVCLRYRVNKCLFVE